MTTTTKAPQALTFHDVMLEAITQQADIEEAKSAGAAVSNHLLVLARTCSIVGTSPTGKKEYKGEPTGFLGDCFVEETWAKSTEAGVHMTDTIPRCWTQAKTNIKAAMLLGLDLNDFETESSLRKAVQEARELMKAAGGEAPEIASTEIQPILDALANVFEGLNGTQQDQMKEALVSLHTKYVVMLDKVLPNTPEAPVAQQVA